MQLIDGRPVYDATDLVGYLACDHRLALERAALVGLVAKPVRNDPSIELVARRGIRPARALQRLRAIAFDAEQARLMQLPEGSPGLFIERRTFLDDGRVVEFTRSFYRGDAYDFVAELHSE